MRFFLLATFLAIFWIPVLGQNFDQYKTLLPQGTIPKDFTEKSSAKVATGITSISEKKARVKKAKQKFVLESTFSIDNFLASGSVLFNDEVSIYLDQVLSELLKPHPELRKQVRVYAVKSSGVNAFTTNDGIIFVNLGLLSRLETEAQLAFILSHEVIHFQKKHAINAYATSIEIYKARGNYRNLSISERGFAKSTYAKELESESDISGADLYMKSGYSKDSVERVFKILSMADFPVLWDGFNKEIFESESFLFPDELNLKEVKPFQIDDDIDDSNRSHPSIKKRREAIATKFRGKNGGDNFLVSQDKFATVRKIAKFELCRLYLLEHRFIETLYLALSLSKENPNSSYLKTSICKALYGVARQRLKAELELKEQWELSDKIWVGESERMFRFIKGQSSYELSVLAMRELYKAKEREPDNEEITHMLNDIIQSFAETHTDGPSNFLRTRSAKPLENLKHPYTQYAFLDARDLKAFFHLFDGQINLAKSNKPSAQSKRGAKQKQKKLNVNKVVLVNPKYSMVDPRKKQKVRHVQSEEVLININGKIEGAAQKLGLQTDIINPNDINASEVSSLRTNSIMHDWISEQMGTELDLVSPIYNEVKEISTLHKTDYFGWMGAITVRHGTYGKPYIILSALILPSTAPFSAFNMIRPKGDTLYYSLIFNVRTQKLEVSDVRFMRIADSAHVLQSNIYYSLFKLKNR